MPLLNYTTKVSVAKSVQEIEKALVKAGAISVVHDYDNDGIVSAVSFRILLQDQYINFRLPISHQSVAQVLRNEGKYRDDEHAKRVAWRILKDWVEEQMALLATKSVSMLARSRFSHKELQGLKTNQILELLQKNGVNWHGLPDRIKHGTFVTSDGQKVHDCQHYDNLAAYMDIGAQA